MKLLTLILFVALSSIGWAQTKPAPAVKKQPTGPAMKPTAADVKYGDHPKQAIDFYQAKSDKPTALMFFIHGGGWVNGNKWSINGLKECLAAGISVVSVEYRFVTEAKEAGIKPPVEWPLRDAARALQLVRSKAKEWNIDTTRIGACGGSAGACSSLWLAFHDDMADPKSSDPIARESTRLNCAAVIGAQTTLDPAQMRAWTPNSRYGGHAFGFSSTATDRDKHFDEFFNSREKVLPWIQAYSPYAHVTADDPPIYMNYSSPPNMGKDEKDPTHSANFGVKLKERLDEVKVPCELFYPNAPDALHKSAADYLIVKLKAN